MATHLFHLDPHHCFFQFFSFFNCSTFTIFGSFGVLNFRIRFEALNNTFLASNGRANMSPFQTYYLLLLDVVIG